MVYFISDTHLGARYIPDAVGHERGLVALLDAIAADATALYLMGDILDFWFEYRSVVPRGFVRFFGALARLADAGVKIYWMRGNHDMWIKDYLPSEIGLTVLDGPVECDIEGKRFLLDHGDHVGYTTFGYKMIRAIFRSPICRWLYATLHPRIALGIAHGWSGESRKSALRKGEQPQVSDPETEPLIAFARERAAASPHVDFIVTGHRHAPYVLDLPGGTRLVMLGDWLNHRSYAKFDGETMTLLTYK